MSERSPHSVQDDVAAVREALNWLTLPDVDGDRERGLSALGRIEEQLETAKDNSPTIGAAYLRLKEQLEACEADRNSLSKSADYLQEQLEAADAALQWIAENHRKAILEMPTPIYRLLRKPSASSLASASALAARNDETAEAEESSPANSPHEHTWSLPGNSGVYRCMTCGVETTDLGAPLPASEPQS